MSNNYLYPKDTFKVNLELEVSLDFVGMWDGVGKSLLETRYKEMLEGGSLTTLLKKYILEDLVNGEAFDISNPEPFDRLCFTIKNAGE